MEKNPIEMSSKTAGGIHLWFDSWHSEASGPQHVCHLAPEIYKLILESVWWILYAVMDILTTGWDLSTELKIGISRLGLTSWNGSMDIPSGNLTELWTITIFHVTFYHETW